MALQMLSNLILSPKYKQGFSFDFINVIVVLHDGVLLHPKCIPTDIPHSDYNFATVAELHACENGDSVQSK